jgi:hypothetical protein
MDWTVRMMQKVCKVFSTAAERKSFLQSIANAFACVTMEMLQPVMSGKLACTQCTGVRSYGGGGVWVFLR